MKIVANKTNKTYFGKYLKNGSKTKKIAVELYSNNIVS